VAPVNETLTTIQQLHNPSITQKDIARHSGVAQSTVSRVLRGDSRVDAILKARVTASIAALGYDPAAHDIARRLVSRRIGKRLKNQTVAMVFPGLIFQDPYFHAMAHGATDALFAAGYSILWVYVDTIASPQMSLDVLPSALRRGEVDGILVCMPNPQLLALLNNLVHSSPVPLPLVSLIRTVDADNSVTADDEGGAYSAMRHLLELGHRHVMQFLDSSFYSYGAQAPLARRIRGVQHALQEAGLAPDEHIHFYPLSDHWMEPSALQDYTKTITPEKARQHPVVAYLLANPQITALLCINDAVAMHAQATLTAAGLNVPDDYSIIGYDDTMTWPDPLIQNSLTTVRLPLYAIGYEGIQLLCRLIDEAPVPQTQIELPTEIILRGSTAAPRLR
jgi:DNA-binding LacI/PurR family transcriptional regulator